MMLNIMEKDRDIDKNKLFYSELGWEVGGTYNFI